MKNAALQWLSRDPLLHVCMSESIRRGHAEILYAGQDGVLLRDPVAETMQASFVSPAALEPWVETIRQSNLDVVVHQDFAEERLASALPERAGRMRCYHSVYTREKHLEAALPEGALAATPLRAAQAELPLTAPPDFAAFSPLGEGAPMEV